jgi:prevent-host-death family protein
MPKRVSSAQAKAHLAELVTAVAYQGERVIIERKGKPLAALVNIRDFERLEQDLDRSGQAPWPLNLVGLFSGVMTDGEVDEMIDAIYGARAADVSRPVDLKG